jgi:hypothetical protein
VFESWELGAGLQRSEIGGRMSEVRAKDAEGAKNFNLESEFFKFIYKSLNVAFEKFAPEVNQ